MRRLDDGLRSVLRMDGRLDTRIRQVAERMQDDYDHDDDYDDDYEDDGDCIVDFERGSKYESMYESSHEWDRPGPERRREEEGVGVGRAAGARVARAAALTLLDVLEEEVRSHLHGEELGPARGQAEARAQQLVVLRLAVEDRLHLVDGQRARLAAAGRTVVAAEAPEASKADGAHGAVVAGDQRVTQGEFAHRAARASYAALRCRQHADDASQPGRVEQLVQIGSRNPERRGFEREAGGANVHDGEAAGGDFGGKNEEQCESSHGLK